MEASMTADLVNGAVFAGRYRIVRRIAVGGMGAVYEVVHIETNRRRALKVMHGHYVASDELRARFRQEARVAAEIDSEHIVDVFDAGIDEATGMPFLVMELLRGQELGKLVKQVGALPKEDVVRYLYETSLALDKTHRARIVHRDLKPDNLYLCERERGPARIKVLDFGIAKIVKEAQTQAQSTRTLGTPLYMAPEQFHLQGAPSAATDIFALGMIAFTLLVGKPYWAKESKIAREVLAFALHASRGPTEPAVARARELTGMALPPAFDAWFFRATARDPTARFAIASEAVLALAEALGVPSPANEDASPKRETPIPVPNVVEPEIEPTTEVFASTSSSSPSGPVLRTAPTQMAVTRREEPRPRAAQGSRSLVIIGLVGAGVVCLGGLFVVKTFAGSSGAPATKSIEQARVSMSAGERPPTLPVVASALPVEPALSELPPPVASASTTVPGVGTLVPTAFWAKPAAKAPAELQKSKKSKAAREEFPDD